MRWRSGAHAHIYIFRSGDILAPSYGPESVLAATHPSNFKRIACAGLGANPCRPNKYIWEHMGTCDTHKICFQGMGEVETVDNTPVLSKRTPPESAHVGSETRNARGAPKTKLRALEVTHTPMGTYLWRFCSPRWRLVAFIALEQFLHAPANTDRRVRDPRT